MFSFRVIGTPSSAERGSPARQRASDARASAIACSALTRYIALMRGSQAVTRSSCARVTSSGESSRCAYAAASSRAERSCIAAICPGIYILAAAVIRTLALSLALSATAQAAEEVRVWHTLDAAMSERLARHAADYNALQQEFRVHLEPLRAAGGKHLVRLPLPLNTARPVLYYNRDAFRRARLDPPKTWYDMAPVLGRLAEAGVACGYTTAWPAWVMLENSGGELSRQLMVRWTSMLASWEKAGYFNYAGRTNEAEARFAAGDCALLTASSDIAAELGKQANFDLGIAPLPYYEDASAVSRTLPASAPAVWVERQSVGVTHFFAFLAARAAEARQRREIMESELEAVWRGEKSAPDALEAYARRAGAR